MRTTLQTGETGKQVSRDFSPFHSIHICYRVSPASHTLVTGAVSLTEQYSTCCIKQNNFLYTVPTLGAH